MILDLHVHPFPNPIGAAGERIRSATGLGRVARAIRRAVGPISSSVHEAQTFSRVLPERLRGLLDNAGQAALLPTLVLGATASDLLADMDATQVDRALAIAHPPWIPNEHVLGLDRTRFSAAVKIARSSKDPAGEVRSLARQGAAALKIHAAADGFRPDSPHYRSQLVAAADCGLPVIIHTGCVHLDLVYRNATLGRAEYYRAWYSEFASIRFVLAHMNFHDPAIAIDLAEEFPNLLLDTSWQPPETIGEAARRLGAERVAFGSDWPFLGRNLAVGLARIDRCVQAGTLTDAQASLVRGENAARLLGLHAA